MKICCMLCNNDRQQRTSGSDSHDDDVVWQSQNVKEEVRESLSLIVQLFQCILAKSQKLVMLLGFTSLAWLIENSFSHVTVPVSLDLFIFWFRFNITIRYH